MALKEPERSVEGIDWGSNSFVIAGGKEGEWIKVNNPQYVFNPEEST